MTINTLNLAIIQQPFRPFSLRLVDGSELVVGSPEMVTFSEQNGLAIVTDDNGNVDWVDVTQIVAVRFEGEPSGRKLEVS
jgi:hypothetical protein